MWVERCEADDIIATLCMNFNVKEKILIVSSDKDFQQLQRYMNVKQYSPIHKNFIYCENPQNFLKEHILRGDTSDGIPNVLSDDDTFVVEGKRQKPLSQKKLELIIENIPEYLRINYNRNQKLVDLSYIPKEYTERILKEYEVEPKVKGKEKLFEYFTNHKLANLMEVIDEF